MRNLVEICEEMVNDAEKLYKLCPDSINRQILRKAKRLLESAKRAAWRERLQKAKGKWENL